MDEVMGMVEPVDLDGLNSTAQLMSRVDWRYFVPRSVFRQLLAETHDDPRLQRIDGRRTFRYHLVHVVRYDRYAHD